MLHLRYRHSLAYLGKPARVCLTVRRRYHETENITYGYRHAREFRLPDYTEDEQNNRHDNANLLRLVQSYRAHGHRAAQLDPLGITTPEPYVQGQITSSPQKSYFFKVMCTSRYVSELDPARYRLDDPSQVFPLNGILHVGKSSDPTIAREHASLSTIVKHLNATYSNHIAYEFSHITDAHERRWFSHMLESLDKKPFSVEEKRRMHSLLTRSEVFDLFMAKKFPGVKRYGLEGGESMMVILDTLFSTANAAGIVDLVLCTAHRGRLNLLTDLLQYDPTVLFAKLKHGTPEYPDEESHVATGDVLSHMAQSVDLKYPGNPRPLHVSLLHNPSHLEAINPVAMGKTRARQMDAAQQGKEGSDCTLGDRVMCVQIHGDAAFAGQGVVMETLGLSNLPHYTCGGSVHVLVNNQVGYTTPATNARSSRYATDVGKMINAPVIHVNGDYPEDVARAVQLGVEYRNKFHKDVLVDLIVYRKWGHNELDEPRFTQPKMYSVIESRASIPRKYENSLVADKVMTEREGDQVRETWYKKLDKDLEAIDTFVPVGDHLKGKWTNMVSPKTAQVSPVTGVDLEVLKKVGLSSVNLPQGFTVHPRLVKFHIQPRQDRLNQNKAVDWATAEALAFGSLMVEGYNVRISGQDVGRGTFSQRHVMLVDQATEDVYTPLNAMGTPGQGMLEVANSHLSEFAVVGFEFGVSWESPTILPIWEAQFGDFWNGSQIIIDTFLSGTEAKWLRQSGMVMLLPHGWDGTGPEHSSSRCERFLQLCTDPVNVLHPEIPRNPNMHVVFPSTPANFFHVLRRQMVRKFRKPLIVVGPKTLLRLPAAVSRLEEMGPGTSFQPVLGDPTNPEAVQRVVLVSGKLYYELIKEREAKGLNEKIAIVRLEELCPFPVPELRHVLDTFCGVKEFIWAQEEPMNQGAWSFVEPRLRQLIPKQGCLMYVGRVCAATPATGVSSVHKREQADVIARAISLS